jgi:hypothetical protein
MHLSSRARRWARLLGTVAIGAVFSVAGLAAPANAYITSNFDQSYSYSDDSTPWGGVEDGNGI